jgi:hypothetical protein
VRVLGNGTLKKDWQGGALDAGHTLEAGLLEYI